MAKTCETCANWGAAEGQGCRSCRDPNLPPGTKWLLLEHLGSKQPGSPYTVTDCHGWADARETCR